MNALRKLIISISLVNFLFPVIIYSADSDAYSHQSTTKIDNSDWMKNVKGSKKISELTLIGTHDTMARYGGDNVQAQSLPLSEQLKAGIRVFDVRCNVNGHSFTIFHGIIYQFANLDDVFRIMTKFLKIHPNETLLVRIQQENSKVNDTVFTKIYDSYRVRYDSYIWKSNNAIPTLDQVRGKIVILNRWNPQGIDYIVGLDWGVFVNALDDYNYVNNWDLYGKYSNIKSRLASMSVNPDLLQVTFLSGSGGSLPYFVVSGHSSSGTNDPALLTGMITLFWNSCCPEFPRVGCISFFNMKFCKIAFTGTNILTYNYIQSTGNKFRGIIMTDFPADNFISQLIKMN